MTRNNVIKSATFMLNDHKSYKNFPDLIPRRLYYCKSWILQSVHSKWILLQSYKTIVAAYDKNTEILFVFGYYSATTSQHVAKFRNWLKYEFCPVSVNRVNLYNDSRTGKRAAQKNIDDDFASVIESALNQH